jgi:hypothetical protein
VERRLIMREINRDAEELRSKLLSEVYAGAVPGMPAMILDESRIRNADADELEKIAKEYGY